MSDFATSQSLAEPAQNVKTATPAEALRRHTATRLERAADPAQKLIQQGREVDRDTTQRVRDQANALVSGAISYTRDEPVKAVLVAATAGALLMGRS